MAQLGPFPARLPQKKLKDAFCLVAQIARQSMVILTSESLTTRGKLKKIKIRNGKPWQTPEGREKYQNSRGKRGRNVSGSNWIQEVISPFEIRIGCFLPTAVRGRSRFIPTD